MKNIAYIGAGEILHVINGETAEKTAREESINGKFIETEISCGGGHGKAFYKGEEQQIIVYGEDEMKIHATGKKIYNARHKFPLLAALYAECRK